MKKVIRKTKLTFHPRALKTRFLHIAMQGDDVECVCCGAKYVTFLPAGLQKRPNARCMNCGSLERHRVLWHFFEKERKIADKPIKVLHVAPEKIFTHNFSLLPNVEYYPIDLMPDSYNYGVKTIQMDVTDMSFADEFFDAIICTHVLEHIRQDQKAMSEMSRVLKKGGWAILNTPVNKTREHTLEDVNLYDPKKQTELFGQPDHVRVYGRDFFSRLANAGFKTEVIDYVGRFESNDQFRYGFKTKEEIFYCTKQ